MFRKARNFFVVLVQKYLPDPFLFAAVLTLIVFVGGLIFTNSTPYQMVQFWGGGFWNLLAFSMQMVLVLVTPAMPWPTALPLRRSWPVFL